MPNHARWYDNPATGLPTIRQSPGAREAATPEQVKAWMQGGSLGASLPDRGWYERGSAKPAPTVDPEDDYDHCPTCGQSTDEEEDPE